MTQQTDPLKTAFDALRGRLCNVVETIAYDSNRIDAACRLVKELTYQTQAEINAFADATPNGIIVEIPDGMTEAEAARIVSEWVAKHQVQRAARA